MSHRARTLIVGPSHWHFPLYADRIQARHDVVGVSDPDLAFVAGIPSLAGVPSVTRWQDLLDAHPDAELAYVFASHSEMSAICHALVERGIPMVVEKPAGVSRGQLAKLREAAERSSVPIIAALVMRDGPVERWLARAGDTSYESAQFIAGPPSRYLTNGSPWMLDLDQAGGGCVINLAPHFVDFFIRAAGVGDITVTSAMSSKLHQSPVEDFAAITMTTSDGRVGSIQVGYAFPSSEAKRYSSWVRVGAAGVASITTDGRASFTDNDGVVHEAQLVVDSDPLYAPFVDRVADGMANRFAGLPTIRDLEGVMSVIWDAYADNKVRALS